MSARPHTLVEVLERHAEMRPLARAFTLLGDGENESATLCFAQLHARVRVIAAWLTRQHLRGCTVLLMMRDGLQFIETFMGCLAAGVIPVPVTFPRPNRQLVTLHAVRKTADARAILAARAEVQPVAGALEAVADGVPWLFLEDAVESDACEIWSPSEDDVAFIQCTSGSTSAPKGVVVTHRNLMCNEAAIRESMGLDGSSLFVGWLPLFHDMGLIGNVLQPLYLGIPCVLMPPVAFLQRPVRWLAAISKYRATVSGAPNFAYDLCVERTTPAQRAALDLSSWGVAFNGSEPVKPHTLERFTEAFACAGFKRKAFFPCYGMAESTLIVTGGSPGREPVVVDFEARPELDLAVTAARKRVVSCGKPVRGARVVIVDADSHVPLAEGRVGEIWIAGDSVARNYFRAPQQTSETFEARLASGEGPFLRSGDLGFLRDGDLFVTGRIKELIIIRGRNHYPQDLEETAGRSNSLLARGAGAAVVLESDEDAGLVTIVHELTRAGWHNARASEVAADVREAVARVHGINVGRVLLIRPGALPRTSSGKIRRQLCRMMVESGDFETLQAASQGTEMLLD